MDNIPIAQTEAGKFLVINVTKRGFPTVSHSSYAKAVSEARRLQRKEPQDMFLVLEAKYVVKPKVIYKLSFQMPLEVMAKLPIELQSQLSYEERQAIFEYQCQQQKN